MKFLGSFIWAALVGVLLVVGDVRAEDDGILDCILKENSATCAAERVARKLDEIELEVAGKKSEVMTSQVLEEAGELIGEGVRAVLPVGRVDSTEDAEEPADEEEGGRDIGEARKKKFGKKKKKTLQKLLMVAMLFKSKISLILQLITTHLQLKFFGLAILSLLLNAARFWIDLKKSHHPAKVIYYEHAQHQHHYDHEDDHGYWGRSADEPAEDRAYSAYAPQQ
ncbi:uncharacterized protein LOC105696187 [Orussus abietinus]|uniref:uncharacterized protein LOC105696187 n=1 Tax=Orussus abietinus TaxID=222816 RepID=UPI000C71618E|nr:uncharacterized protein LOC105696187 [Orussus abietinus]